MSKDRKPNAAILILLLSLNLTASQDAFAQQPNLEAAAIRKNFDDCFYGSVAEQLKSSRSTDYNMVSENAFQACSTEERAIGLLLTANNVERQMVATLLIRIRLDLKKSIRAIAANPNRYLK